MSLPWDTFRSNQPPLNAGDHPADLTSAEPIIILGAGLAGCWLAWLLAERGVRVRVLDQASRVGRGASGNPAGIAKPYVTRTPNHAMRFHTVAYAYLQQQLKLLPDTGAQSVGSHRINACGVLQLVGSGYSESAHYRSIDARETERIAGVPVSSCALHFEDAGWLNPGALCQVLMNHVNITLDCEKRVSDIRSVGDTPQQTCWRLSLDDQSTRWSRRLVLCCGEHLHRFTQTQALPVVPARGQLSRFTLAANAASPNCVINGRHYVIPHEGTVLVGATFDRDVIDSRVRAGDHARNLAGLRATVPGLQVDPVAIEGFAGVRATTPDRLPIAGPVPDFQLAASDYMDLRHGRSLEQLPHLSCQTGLYVLGGLGSRGIVTAPLAACIVADLLTGSTGSTWHEWAPLLNPVRFLIRDLKRGKTPGAL